MLIDLEMQPAVSISFGHLTEVGIGDGISSQTLFELRIVGIDFCGTVIFVGIQFDYFSFLLGYYMRTKVLHNLNRNRHRKSRIQAKEPLNKPSAAERQI